MPVRPAGSREAPEAGRLSSGSRYSSLLWRSSCRRNTSQLPSGETAGLVSPAAGNCGWVNGLFSPVSSETTNKAAGWPSPGESVTTKQLLSGHQAWYGGGVEEGKVKRE